MKDDQTGLRALREKVARKAKIEAMLEDLQIQRADLEEQERYLDGIRCKEQSDVERLEQGGLASFFYTVLSKKEERLDQEKAEAYAAALKHSAAVRQLRAAEGEIASLEAELAALCDVQARFDAAFTRRAAALKAENPAAGAEILRLEERLGRIADEQREADEALSAGDAVLGQIESIESALGSAEGWGTFDLLGGGLISDLAKHSHLDNAQAQIYDLQELLRRYRTELADVTVYADIQVQIDGFLRFADYFFDGLFADWAVLDSIHRSQQQIYDTHTQVEEVQNRLFAIKETLCAEADGLRARLSDIVLNG